MVAPAPVAVSAIEELPVKKEILAELLPTAVGEKVIVNGTLCPADIVNGRLSPANVNWELVELADDSVTLPPLAVTEPF